MHPNAHCSTVYNSQICESDQSVHQQRNDKEDVVHIYNEILLSHRKKNKIMPFAAMSMDQEIDTQSEVSSDQISRSVVSDSL